MNDKVKKIVTVTPEYLADRGYTLTKAANAAGCSVTHLRLIIKGERTASKQLMKNLKSLPKYHPIKARVSYARVSENQ